MKNLIIFLLLPTFILVAQKKIKNGTVYINHPGIDLINKFNKAFVEADTITLNEILHKDFKRRNGISQDKSDTGDTKSQFIQKSIYWNSNIQNLSIIQAKPAYPDAIEYKEGNQLWVQSWDKVNGYHKSTGVKLDAPLHRLYRLTSDAKKILWIAEYFDTKIYWDIWSGDGKDRKNGEIYMEHENINTVRKVMYSFEFGNYEEAYSYFDKDAIIYDINLPIDKTLTLEEGIESDKTFLNSYEIESIDMRGYVDYLNYDWGDANSALSWWTFRLKRKKDDKKIVLPVHIQDSFNDEGKINRRVLYYSMKLLEN